MKSVLPLEKLFERTADALLYRYISANVSETDQVETIFASNVPEMYPVGLCLHILPGAFLHFDAGSWSDL